MKTKLKRCLAAILIIVTCFCVTDNNFIVGKFFAKFIVPTVYAEPANPYEAEPTEEEKDALFPSRMVDIARKIANDTYVSTEFPDQVRAPYTYLWGGDGEQHGSSPAKGRYGTWYTVYDCRGLVAASIRYAARELHMSDVLKDMHINGTSNEYNDLVPNTGYMFGCSKLVTESELQDGDILWRDGHTEIFARASDGSPMQIGAWATSWEFKRDESCGGGWGDENPADSIKEYNFQGVGSWECYFRYGGPNTYTPTGTVRAPGADETEGNLGSGRHYIGPADEKAELDEQVFDFQGNPQIMIFEGETDFDGWLFTLLSQFLDFITGLLVSLLINPIMQLLNAIVNFLTNFINYISGLPTGT